MFGENPRRDMLYQPSAQLLAWTAFRRNRLLGFGAQVTSKRFEHLQSVLIFMENPRLYRLYPNSKGESVTKAVECRKIVSTLATGASRNLQNHL